MENRDSPSGKRESIIGWNISTKHSPKKFHFCLKCFIGIYWFGGHHIITEISHSQDVIWNGRPQSSKVATQIWVSNTTPKHCDVASVRFGCKKASRQEHLSPLPLFHPLKIFHHGLCSLEPLFSIQQKLQMFINPRTFLMLESELCPLESQD